ncbi:DUF6291 domain-containing protein [Bacteroides xylanisolvens]|uniref:DUF6291 domain-containing protein n=1 Tax=Bacteroides xylanisolvens TaxID=371601 RepID=A0AAW4SHZ2_9BACE|nr:DUF6291 domain-containing protein [Bacteroides xylanisolvens]MCA4465840.1 DUF6291 domain-containing protein [Bacteroides xylanisolvens]MCA4470287.1 DUF6291 domain-containing protein [Bacteroides xylanisolvens]MCA4478201.1 DUF6291 domain-containing protein [Bacteroides xylanisolvens]MCA4487442.1 DUF6291 domain-containing protein [Bacteroides xylanisolvens]MCA4493098.1 DUF6291 domain-containing protein [Bacteroides xylanisolvens]
MSKQEEWISIIYYKRWAEMLMKMPAELRHKIHDAVDEYIVNRALPTDEQILFSTFFSIKEQIDYDKEVYNSKVVRRNRENGRLGGRPKKNPNNPQNPVGLQEPKKADTVTDTVTVSTEVDIKENTIVSKKDELSLSSPSEEFIKFNQWLEEHCPFVLKVKTQMTEPEYQKLLAKYTKKEISDVLESLNNWKDFPKKRTNVYRSTLDELKKKFGER